MELDDHGNGSHANFWTELDSLLAQECTAHSDIDHTLRSYLSLIAHSRGNAIQTDDELDQCAYKLATSPLFGLHADYIRRQFVYSLLQEDDTGTLLATASFLLVDARTTTRTFEVLNEAGAFTRLIDLIGKSPKHEEEEGLDRLLMQLLYEMARIQEISLADLGYVGDEFVCRLFDIIEQVSNDVSDPYHYPVIRVLLVLNEQFMVAAHHPLSSKSTIPLTNKVVKVLSAQGSKYKTFGENIILLLNREDETSLQLLTLKLLYLLFTTPSTYEYFYTNDLRVLVDILVRNLLDLPEEAAALRHTYLRVLYPLLQHTQLQNPPHYKRAEIRKLLIILGGGQILEEREDDTSLRSWAYFEEIDDTTKRLSPVENDASPEPASPVSPSKPLPPAVPAPRKLTKRSSSKASTLTAGQFFAPQLENARKSSCSMLEMAGQKEKPGVITPSRNPALKHTLRSNIIQKEKPPLPQARRSGGSRTPAERPTTDAQTEEGLARSPAVISPGQPATSSPHPHVPATSKKPPPAPKARRWGRGKRLRDEESRPPGRFNATLPSVNTSINDKRIAPPKKPEPPASPEHHMSSVREQLDQAQKQAVDGIADTLNRARLEGGHNMPPSPDRVSMRRNGSILDTIVERPAVVVQHMVLSSPESPSRPDSLPSTEMERSPFLSETELEDGSDGGASFYPAHGTATLPKSHTRLGILAVVGLGGLNKTFGQTIMKMHVVGLLALAGLGMAIPQGHHRNNHANIHKAYQEAYTYTTVVTSVHVETEPAAVIWVDQNGKVLSTQFNQAPAPTPDIPQASIISVPAEPTSNPVNPAVAAPADNEAVTVPGFWPSEPETDDGNNKAVQVPAAASGFGICYDMIHSGPCKDAATIDRDMTVLSNNGYKLVRTYDVGCDVGLLAKSALNHGMMAFVGINTISNVEADIRKLISYISAADAWAGVHTVNIGNEIVNNGGSAAAVVAAIGVAKPLLQQAGYTGNIVTVDTHNQHLANPSLCEASSYCAVNAQPFFDPSCDSSEAGNWVLDRFNAVSAKSGKSVVITEAGWPYGGSNNGAAVASPSDQTTAINGIKQAFSDKPGNVYVFQGFDTAYKAPGPMGIEQYFGIFDH
ncbi:hypothetical protein DV735_g2791, partial [Chaetothyriales sp. CBS 134920]